MPNFACFWPLIFFGKGSSEILDQDYKIEHTSDHGAKFCGNRPTKLRDLARGKKKRNASKI